MGACAHRELFLSRNPNMLQQTSRFTSPHAAMAPNYADAQFSRHVHATPNSQA